MDKIWHGKWIMDPEFYGLAPINLFHKQNDKHCLPEHIEKLRNRHMLIRKEFDVSRAFDECLIDITGDDYYKLYINGQFVGQGPAPGYYFHYNYNRYDVSKYLKEGKNVISVHLYYQGLVNRVWNSGDYRQGMIAEVIADGDCIVSTDSTWKYIISRAYTGQTTGYETQYLENIDSRLEERGWKELSFDDSHWKNACENITDDHKFYLQETPSVQVYEEKPLLVQEIERGHYLIDFGHELTGQFKMEACGKEGQVIEIRHGEEVEDGSVRFEMRCNCHYQEFWTLSGKGTDVLEFYDYKGFRYVEVIGSEDVINTNSFSAIVRHYPMESVCRFSSSDDLLNNIWEICARGVKFGSQEGYLDCPTREKGQYLGDLTVTAHSQIYLSGDLRLFKKAIKDFALSTVICPGIMGVAPGSLMQEIADYSLQWPMSLIRYYEQSGDIKFLEEMYPIAENLYSYFKKYQCSDGLLENVNEKWNLVDWPDNLRDGYDFELKDPIGPGCHNVINAFYYGFVKDVNRIRDILGIEYEDETSHIKKSFIQKFYNSSSRLFVDAEGSSHSAVHSNILPLLFDLVPEEAKKDVVSFIKTKGFSCGVYMAYFLLKALARVGEYRAVYDLITSKDEYSWANMIKEGATTCFEAWGKDYKWNTSLCHPWASAPISVLIEDIVGLTPAEPGWKKIRFSPHIPHCLSSLTLEVKVKSGKIKVEKDNGELKLEVPDGVDVVKSY